MRSKKREMNFEEVMVIWWLKKNHYFRFTGPAGNEEKDFLSRLENNLARQQINHRRPIVCVGFVQIL